MRTIISLWSDRDRRRATSGTAYQGEGDGEIIVNISIDQLRIEELREIGVLFVEKVIKNIMELYL